MKINWMIKQSKNNSKKGMALITVILLMLVFTILFSGGIFIATQNSKSAVKAQNYTETYYSAESGINVMAELIRQASTLLYDSSTDNDVFKDTLDAKVSNGLATTGVTNIAPNKYLVSMGDISSEVTITPLLVDDEMVATFVRARYQIDAVGTKDYETRSLSTTMNVQYYLPKPDGGGNTFYSDSAVLVSGNINMSGSALVEDGPITTTSLSNSAITFSGNPKVNNIQIRNLQSPCSANIGSDKPISAPDWWVKQENICATGSSKLKEYTRDPFLPTIVMPTIPTATAKLPKLTIKPQWSSFELVNSNGDLTFNWSWFEGSDNYTYVIPAASDTYYVPKFHLTANHPLQLIIDVGDRDISIVTDSLKMSSHFKVQGSGTLTIYVNDTNTNNIEMNLTSADPGVGNKEDVNKTIVYVYGKYTVTEKKEKKVVNKKITASGNSNYYISIMGEYLDVEFTGSAKFNGNLVTGGSNVTVSGGSTSSAQLFYSPYASVNFVGSGTLYGAVIAKDFTASGGSKLYYSPEAFENLPFDITSPVGGDSGGSGGGGSGPGSGDEANRIFIINQTPIVEQ